MKLIWLAQARRERQNQMTYLAYRNPQAAAEVGDRLMRAVRMLTLCPESGRIGRLRHTCELVLPQTPFIVTYRLSPSGDTIHILRLLHAAQKWAPE
ncbi:type II toxin-antitoxin system RelE/ParE family toxin [Rhizobium sp. TRM95796]|uniref:type II toxin-antitoxin system RelE/ParE family toxin n=1 Tax=Rhizobium sp. TRM95796 TaxID=2979862 RepID=UPI0021E880DA|nr:type II toxin-antitoxin system RelE/ParE family toxin [Rhizobium sp. TRM95796]MCV3768576.1 type II toxin-antitoxin system RelE/ParE family toxin [Rhizobium sp. TRM95796]